MAWPLPFWRSCFTDARDGSRPSAVEETRTIAAPVIAQNPKRGFHQPCGNGYHAIYAGGRIWMTLAQALDHESVARSSVVAVTARIVRATACVHACPMVVHAHWLNRVVAFARRGPLPSTHPRATIVPARGPPDAKRQHHHTQRQEEWHPLHFVRCTYFFERTSYSHGVQPRVGRRPASSAAIHPPWASG